jgi:hypothetical protein
MATLNKERVTRVDGKSNMMLFPEASGQTFKEGQLVYLDSSGQVNVTAASTVKILGIAGQDASGTQATKIQVDVLRPGDFFKISVYHATAASATMADADMPKTYDIYAGTGVTYLGKAGTTYNNLVAVARFAGDAATDLYPRVIACVPSAMLQSNGVGV